MPARELERFVPQDHNPSALEGEVPCRVFPYAGVRHWVFKHDLVSVTYVESVWSRNYNATGVKARWSFLALGTGVAVFGLSFARYQLGVTPLSALPSAVFGPEQIAIASATTPQVTTHATLEIPAGSVPMLPTEFYRVRVRFLGTHASRTLNAAARVDSLVLENLLDTP